MEKEKQDSLLIDDSRYETEIPESYEKKSTSKGESDPKEIRAIIPGVIKSINTEINKTVFPGDVVVVLEAMKMYNDIEVETGGRVAEICVSEGDKVTKGQLMIRLA